MNTEQKMEQILKEKNRLTFYNYYLYLGYDPKTAACLALFTYGHYRFRDFSMDDLYDALSKGEEYLPPEVIERQKRQKHRSIFGGMKRSGGLGVSSASFFAPVPAPRAQMTSASVANEIVYGGAPPCSAPAGSMTAGGAQSPLIPDGSDEAFFCARECYSEPMYAPARINPNPLQFAGALGYATDEYEHIEEKDARTAAAEPTSTFRMTTNTASAGVILNQLRNGRRIDRSMVRIEEMLNYFRYESEVPAEEMFKLTYEIMDAEKNKKYLYINVQGKEEVKEYQNIIILLDVSGSMSGNTEDTQAIIATIVSKLGNGDKISLITYSDDDIVELEAFSVNGYEDRIRVLEKLLSIEITGCTNGSKGIEQAYKIGKKNYIPGGNNQVILITDGDLNFGITDKGGLEELIEKKKKDNLFLSVIGTGLYNYKDDKLEVLSKHGNGVYRTVNNLADVRKSIDEEYASLVNIIAKDVKAQVEFNPEVVENYRLLGFENRALAREDFTNDKVISEPFGSGGYGVALYEITPADGSGTEQPDLRYTRVSTTGSEELGTVKIRWKEPLEDRSHEITHVIPDAEERYSDNLLLAYAAYVCAEKLRDSAMTGAKEEAEAKAAIEELGPAIRAMNIDDLDKLKEILYRSKEELNVGRRSRRDYPW